MITTILLLFLVGTSISAESQFDDFSEFEVEDLTHRKSEEIKEKEVRRTELSFQLPEGLQENLTRDLKLLAEHPEENIAGIGANVNKYADQIITNVERLMTRLGLDPMQIPDVHKGFKKRFIFITYSGSIDLTHGWLTDVSTIHRDGDIMVNYSPTSRQFYVDIPVGFNDLMFNYKYSAKFMGLGPTGGVEGKLSNVKILIRLSIDFESYEAAIDTFKITNSGFININFTGHFLTDWIVNLFTDVISLFLHNMILNTVSGMIHDGLNEVVGVINEFIHLILYPPKIDSQPIVDAILKRIHHI